MNTHARSESIDELVAFQQDQVRSMQEIIKQYAERRQGHFFSGASMSFGPNPYLRGRRRRPSAAEVEEVLRRIERESYRDEGKDSEP